MDPISIPTHMAIKVTAKVLGTPFKTSIIVWKIKVT